MTGFGEIHWGDSQERLSLYNITDEKDRREALRLTAEYRAAQPIEREAAAGGANVVPFPRPPQG